MQSIIAFGNPLLDTTITINNDDLLKKYNLKKDDQKEIATNELKLLLHDIKEYDQKFSPGGCAQNTLRVIQWLVKKQFTTIIFGAIGNDEQGLILEKLLQKDGVQTSYIKQNNYSTGTSIALVNGVNRSLVACLGAAEMISLNDLQSPNFNIMKLINDSHVVYMEGFFLTKRLEIAKFILDYCNKNNKLFAFNLSAQYICEQYSNNLDDFTKNCDILFGNRREFQALLKISKNHQTIHDLAIELSKEGKSKCEPYGKIIVITNGSKSVKTIYSNGKFEKMNVPQLKANEIQDTTGAGDAFVSGFLVGLIQKQTPMNCAKLGCFAAQEIIKRIGCTIPDTEPDFQKVFE